MEIKQTPTIPQLCFNWKTVFKIFFSILITIITIIYLYKYIPFQEFLESIQKTSPVIIIFCSLFFLINFFFRALRIYFLLMKKICLPTLYLITIAHNSLTQLLPFRIGEFSFFYFTHKTKKVTALESALALITARFFDVMIVITITILSSLFLQDSRVPHLRTLILVLIVFLLGLCLLLFYLMKNTKINQEINKNNQPGWLLRFTDMIQKIILFLQSFRSKTFIFIIALSSLCIWSSFYLFIYNFYKYVGISLPFTTFMFIASVTTLFAIIPFQGIAGFGNIEISWGVLLTLFGIESTLALQSTVFIHVINIISIIFICILGLLLLRFIHPTDQHS